MNASLTSLDWVVIGAYFTLTMLVGLFMGRFVKGSKDFFSGGKKVPWWMGVYLCVAMGVVSGILLKTCWKDLSWEAGTFVQVGVCFAGFFGGALFGTGNREEESRDGLFNVLLATKNTKGTKDDNGRVGYVETCRNKEEA